MAGKVGYSVVVVEINEIAGERVRCKVVAYTAKSMARCRAYCEKRWGWDLPQGAVIRDNQDGTEFRPYGTGF